MSSELEPPTTPSHWQVAEDGAPVPVDLLEPPRYRCSEDGTRVYSLADVAAHDEAFHAKTDGSPGLPSVDDSFVRQVALDRAVASLRGDETSEQIAERARTFEGFLRGEQPAEGVVRASLADDAPDALHDALDRAWSSIEDHGDHQTVDEDGDEEILEKLRTLTDADLRRAGFVLSIVRGLSMIDRGNRS